MVYAPNCLALSMHRETTQHQSDVAIDDPPKGFLDRAARLASMSDVLRVSRAAADDWQVVRETRLSALADAPFAFGSTLERESAFGDEEWQRRVQHGNWFLAWAGQQPVGIVAGIQETGQQEERHLVAMWVHGDQRGTTVAADLVDAVCRWAGLQGAKRVTLWVADGNPRARRFYERLGFRATGQRQSLPSAPEIGEELMQRQVDG